mmetsp:Transcript_16827/g.11957  ORF Transcript_16827/g.11957 Transcript_16827/m.11957 type:complete len:85 (-) Transcript_16827:153-407(-)
MVNNIGSTQYFTHRSQMASCFKCGKHAQTRVTQQLSDLGWIFVCILCCLTGICCFIPCLIDDLYDTTHYCGECDQLLAVKNAQD